MIFGSCHVPLWTPFVMDRIELPPGTPAHILRTVSPWSFETALALLERYRPAAVMLNGEPPIWSICP